MFVRVVEIGYDGDHSIPDWQSPKNDDASNPPASLIELIKCNHGKKGPWD